MTAHKPHFVDELVDNASDICIGAYVDWQRAPTKKNKPRRTLRGNDRCFTFSIQRLGFRGNLNVVARSPAQSHLFSLFLDCDQKFVSKVLQRDRTPGDQLVSHRSPLVFGRWDLLPTQVETSPARSLFFFFCSSGDCSAR